MGRSKLVAAGAVAAGLVTVGGAGAVTIAYTSLGASSSHVWVMRGDGSERTGSQPPRWSTSRRRFRRPARASSSCGGGPEAGTTSSASASAARACCAFPRTQVAEADPTWSPQGSDRLLGWPGDWLLRSVRPQAGRERAPAADEQRRRRRRSGLVAERRPPRVHAPRSREERGDLPHRQCRSRAAAPNQPLRRRRQPGLVVHGLDRLRQARGSRQRTPPGSPGRDGQPQDRAGQPRSKRADLVAQRLAARLRALGRERHRALSRLGEGHRPPAATWNAVPDFGPVWGPQGGRIAFTRVSGGSNDVWTMLPDGSHKERLTSGNSHEAVSDWSAGP